MGTGKPLLGPSTAPPGATGLASRAPVADASSPAQLGSVPVATAPPAAPRLRGLHHRKGPAAPSDVSPLSSHRAALRADAGNQAEVVNALQAARSRHMPGVKHTDGTPAMGLASADLSRALAGRLAALQPALSPEAIAAADRLQLQTHADATSHASVDPAAPWGATATPAARRTAERLAGGGLGPFWAEVLHSTESPLRLPGREPGEAARPGRLEGGTPSHPAQPLPDQPAGGLALRCEFQVRGATAFVEAGGEATPLDPRLSHATLRFDVTIAADGGASLAAPLAFDYQICRADEPRPRLDLIAPGA